MTDYFLPKPTLNRFRSSLWIHCGLIFCFKHSNSRIGAKNVFHLLLLLLLVSLSEPHSEGISVHQMCWSFSIIPQVGVGNLLKNKTLHSKIGAKFAIQIQPTSLLPKKRLPKPIRKAFRSIDGTFGSRLPKPMRKMLRSIWRSADAVSSFWNFFILKFSKCVRDPRKTSQNHQWIFLANKIALRPCFQWKKLLKFSYETFSEPSNFLGNL